MYKIYLPFLIITLLITSLVAFSYLTIGDSHRYITQDTSDLAKMSESIPETGVVFGSAIDPQGKPRPVLKERLNTVLDLYREEAISRIIVSGYVSDDSGYNEPLAMKNFLLEKGVKENDITQDYNGDNTKATCQESKEKFDINRSVLISQSSHLDRAVFLCRSIGIEAYGYAANTVGSPSHKVSQSVRESLANVKAIFDVKVFNKQEN